MKVWRQRERRLEELRVAAYEYLHQDGGVYGTRDGKVTVRSLFIEVQDLTSFLEAAKVGLDEATIEASEDEVLVTWYE